MEQIEGFFLSFDKEDMQWIRERLAVLGYSEGVDGLKEVIFDALDDEENPERERDRANIGKIQDFINNNPEVVQIGSVLLKGIVNKIKKPR